MFRRAAVLALLLPACSSPADDGSLGARIYQTNCATCHQADGRGVPGIYPPFAAEWIDGDDGRLIRLVLHGMRGPVEVEGVTYNNVMTAHGFLSDDQIAAVLTYVRQTYGTSADSIRAEDVAAVRAAERRLDPWTADELRTATGIPE